MTNPVLADRYEQVCTAFSDIREHLPTFVATVEELDATRVIELGVRYGVSTIAWLKALEGQGHLWSVDLALPSIGPDIPVNLLDPRGPLGVIPWWTFLFGDDLSEVVLAVLPDQVDVVFIDTQHTYEQTTAELAEFYPRVRPGGRILLHDTALESTPNATTPQPPYPVRAAVEDFCTARHLSRSYVPDCFGLGTIYCS